MFDDVSSLLSTLCVVLLDIVLRPTATAGRAAGVADIAPAAEIEAGIVVVIAAVVAGVLALIVRMRKR